MKGFQAYLNYEQELDIRRTFDKVKENFPEIYIKNLKVVHNPAIKSIAIGYNFVKGTSLEPTILVGKLYDNYTKEEKEAVIAHELGHLKRYQKKKPTLSTCRQHVEWDSQLDNHDKQNLFKRILSTLTKKKRTRLGRIRKQYFLNELYADNEAAEKGYTQGLIDALKRNSDKSTPTGKICAPLRIKNLERRLK